MKTSKLKAKKNYKGWVKYFIFNLILFGAIFAFQMVKGEEAFAADFEYVVNNSNYAGKDEGGNSTSKNAVVQDRYDTNDDPDYKYVYSVQGKGIGISDTDESDVVSLTITKTIATGEEVNSIAVFETGYTTSGSTGSQRHYDIYIKDYTTWTSYLAANAGETKQDDAVVTGTCSVFDASDARLVSNGGSVYSLFCIDESVAGEITIQYAYTMRNDGYGVRQVAFAFYNDEPAENPINADYKFVEFIISKPISQFDFNWIGISGTDSDDDDIKTNACEESEDASSGTSPDTKKICVKYINLDPEDYTNEARPMEIYIPKEAGYKHDVSLERDVK